MAERLKNKVAVVTGSGAGIGRALAMAMAKEGAKVVTNNRKPGSPGGDAGLTAKQIKEIGGEAVPFYGDVGDYEAAGKLIKTAIDNFGKVDILANIAGYGVGGHIWETKEEDFYSVIRTCIMGSFNCIRHASPYMMQQRWGRIINTASLAWLRGPGNGAYAAAKSGLIGLTRTVALDLKDYGITCNVFAPIAASRGMGSPQSRARYKERYEAGQISKAHYEIAGNPPDPITVTPLLIYLCTDGAANISGHLFRITGGRLGLCWQPLNRNTIYKPEGLWTVEELAVQVPEVLMEGYIDPTKI